MTYAFVIHNWKFITLHIWCPTSYGTMCGFLRSDGDAVQEPTWCTATWLHGSLGPMVILSDGCPMKGNSEPRILNLFCMLVTWMPIKGFFFKTCCNFVPGDKSCDLFCHGFTSFFCLCHFSIYVVRYCAESSIDLNPPFKSTMVSFDLENFEKFWQNGHPIAP